MATIHFHGATQQVTGSCHLIESTAIGKVLLDCGMEQGGDDGELYQKQFAFNPQQIDAVILSHAHLDHSGMLPKLVRQGFHGRIYCTHVTKALLEVMLKDAVSIYLHDLERENIRRARQGEGPLQPIIEQTDVQKTLSLCQTYDYLESISIGSAGVLKFRDAGHILGSSIVELTLTERGERKVLVFSGDLGNPDTVLMKAPSAVYHADVLMMESTYGDRDHRNYTNTCSQFAELLDKAKKQGGNVLIPSFAVGRTQELLFHLGCLYHQGKLEGWQVFLDSPMAIAVTEIYDRWAALLDKKAMNHLAKYNYDSLQSFLPNLHLTPDPEQSMALNRIKGGAIIIAGSGMCTGGRIRQHFKHRLWRTDTTVIFVGFQARNSLGRLLVDGIKHVKLFGEQIAVKAQIETLGGFSAHAGKTQLMEWQQHFKDSPKTILVHGEVNALESLAQSLWSDYHVKAMIPHEGELFSF
ncbi:MBL fold metallo-hydrolase RNA specificity domain-containing protein [Pseudoalteromonas xiamenensis]|uniref:MBL fold metallo-hydrolase n=1 Tax=Pseudoalteromonas xiamenensis TaxID=882626 RepID=A0A975DI61_9GAMM|nr:MBL fold metallo-hydrolase [Pseudoalteromonas xiamenensis]QTH72135.1 MBL fold metallo-hydrolase [Pseudoalteromonas xiamenensis]